MWAQKIPVLMLLLLLHSILQIQARQQSGRFYLLWRHCLFMGGSVSKTWNDFVYGCPLRLDDLTGLWYPCPYKSLQTCTVWPLEARRCKYIKVNDHINFISAQLKIVLTYFVKNLLKWLRKTFEKWKVSTISGLQYYFQLATWDFYNYSCTDLSQVFNLFCLNNLASPALVKLSVYQIHLDNINQHI